MHFQLELDDFADVETWQWRLETAQGDVLARSPDTAASEDEARTQIATLRKSGGGLKFAKVIGP